MKYNFGGEASVKVESCFLEDRKGNGKVTLIWIIRKYCRAEVDGTGSGSCPMAGFDISSSIEPFGSVVSELEYLP
jgi:hypothetical protein